MSIPEELQPLLAAIRSLQRLIDRFEQKGMIIGGIAVSLLARIRYTADALDRVRIQKWVQLFADLLETPELWGDLEPLLHKS